MSVAGQPQTIESVPESATPAAQADSSMPQSPRLLLGLAPIGLLLFGFFLIPLTIMVLYSFWRAEGFQIVHSWTLDNYAKFFTLPAYTKVLFRTFIIATSVTGLSLLLGYPFAYFLVRYTPARWQQLFLVLVILPFWTSYLLRVYAWMSILGEKGLVNQALILMGLINEPIRVFLYNQYAIVLVSLYLYVPFAIITLYASLEKFDFTQMHAAADLGATPWEAFRNVLLPQTKAGFITAAIFIFIPMLGEYATPTLVGGAEGAMIANLVVNLFRGFQFPQGAAITFVVVLCILALLIALQRYIRVEELYRR
ncbi:MAG: ABC transporter permease [Anaerolineales bacterium]|nr:ABC transporter permease [Anaerolineales bacterium]